jgi:ketosteroid isomerase-like protein
MCIIAVIHAPEPPMMLAVLLLAAAAQMPAAEQQVRAADAAFWQAFNRCDEAAMRRLLAPDVEFYHDKTGLTASRTAVTRSLMKGPCGTPGLHVRREAVADSISYDPVPGYGAILTGRHRFYARNGGGPERLDGEARFAVVWQSTGGQWRMRRILSYAHRPARD